MGHLPIVILKTMNVILRTGYISIKGTLGKRAEKTIADMFSDVLATREGDLLYPWIIKEQKIKGITPNNDPNLLGFHYRLEVAGSPIFVQGDEYPIKIPVRTNYRSYEENLKEEDALDIFQKELLWNAIGKKSLGRGRGITHQSPREDEILEKMFGNYHNSTLEREDLVGVPITINLDQTLQKLEDSLNYLNDFPDDMKLRNVNIEQVPWVNGGEFKTEKAMEAWLMENIDSNDNHFQDFFPEDSELTWFANYLPYGVSGKNLDTVALHTHPNDGKFVSVIELKKGRLSRSGLTSTIDQVKRYSIFIKKAFRMDDDQVYPYILCHLNTQNARDLDSIVHLKNFHMNDVRIIGYEINEGNIIFEEI